MAVQENDETFPESSEIWSAIGVSGKALQCPTAGKSVANAYAYNSNLSGQGYGAVRDVVRVMMTCDALIDDNIITRETVSGIARRHQDKAIVSYADGHVTMPSSSIVGFLWEEMSPVKVTDDFTDVEISKNWKFYSSFDKVSNLLGNELAAPDANSKAKLIKSPDFGGNGINVKADGGSIIYEFETPLIGDFALEFDVIYSAGSKASLVGLYDESGNMMIEFATSNNLGPQIYLSDANGGYSGEHYKIAGLADDNNSPISGKSHAAISRFGSKVNLTMTGDSNVDLTFPKAREGDGQQSTQMWNTGGPVKYAAFRVADSGNSTYANLEIYR